MADHNPHRSHALRMADEQVANLAAMSGAELDEYVDAIEAEAAERGDELLEEAAARKEMHRRRN